MDDWFRRIHAEAKDIVTGGITRVGDSSRQPMMVKILSKFVLVILLPFSALAKAPVITSDTVPPGCKQGSTHQFAATGSGITWSVTGGGSIDSSTGLYTCPTIHPKNQSRGCQVLPQNNAYNVPIGSLPMMARSAAWMARPHAYGTQYATYHRWVSFFGAVSNYFDNVVTNATPTQMMWEPGDRNYPDKHGYNGTPQPMPIRLDPNVEAQAGLYYFNTQGADHHLFRMNTDTCAETEQYQIFQDFENPVFTSGNPTRVSFDSAQIYTSASPMVVWVGNASGCWSVLNTPAAPTLSLISAGSLIGQRKIYVATSLVATTGEVQGSPTASLDVTDNHELQVTSPAGGTGITGWNVYIGASAATLKKQNTSPLITGAPYVVTSTPSTSGASPLSWGTAWKSTVIDRTHITLPIDSSACTGTTTTLYLWPGSSCRTAAAGKSNTAGVVKAFVDSNIILDSDNAAGDPIIATTPKAQEFYDAVQKCVAAANCATADLGHTVRTTVTNSFIPGYFVWPATRFASAYYNGYSPAAANCRPGSPTVCASSWNFQTVAIPCADGVYAQGCQFGIFFAQQNQSAGPTYGKFVDQFTGKWAQLNMSYAGATNPVSNTAVAFTATVEDPSHFSIPVDSTSWGPPNTTAARFYLDMIPDGGWFRLKPSFDNSAICAGTGNWVNYCNVYLNTLKNYGFLMMDGTIPSDNWDFGFMGSEFADPERALAGDNIYKYFYNSAHYFDTFIEAVDTSSLQLNPRAVLDASSTLGRTVVTATNGSGSASIDVYPQGVAVGVFPETVSIATGATYQFHPWITGTVRSTAVTYSMSPALTGASLSPTGLFTAPPLGTTYTLIPHTVVTITSVADPNAVAYVWVEIIPTSSDGAIRLMSAGNQLPPSGWSPTYTDSHGFLWNGGTSSTLSPRLMALSQSGYYAVGNAVSGWLGPMTDKNLYWSVYDTYSGDILTRLMVPSGTYRVTLYGMSPLAVGSYVPSANTSTFDWELNGVTAASYADNYVLAGNRSPAGFSLMATTTVTNGVLVSGVRRRDRGLYTYGGFYGALLVEPITSPAMKFGAGLFVGSGIKVH